MATESVMHHSLTFTYQSSLGRNTARESELNKMLQEGWLVDQVQVKTHSESHETLDEFLPGGRGEMRDKPVKLKKQTSYVTVSVVLKRTKK